MITIYQNKGNVATKSLLRCSSCHRVLSNPLLDGKELNGNMRLQIKCVCGTLNQYPPIETKSGEMKSF